MKRIFITGSLLLAAGCSTGNKTSTTQTSKTDDIPLITQIQQITFDGPRAGEGYFSADGELMIFQSERDASNPFYQMYITNFNSGKTTRVSNGIGKTTCGWVFPDKKNVLFSSTHLDSQSKAKQKAELDFRSSGQQRRYSWDYDESYDIFKVSMDGKRQSNLTQVRGYDAEGSVSPDGQQIVFASNRLAYITNLNEEDKIKLAENPSFFMDLYIMNSDGSNVRQLTKSPGYDGGPFFSPDGKRIVWRRFTPDGHKSEVFTMKVDGTDEKQITRLNAMSWAPFYHPSGDYIVFTTNIHGYQNFELYVVDVEGRHDPVRVTTLDGFDGLPVFTPDGADLTWNRKLSADQSQIMKAKWNDFAAREALGLPMAPPHLKLMSSDIEESDLKTLVEYMASEKLEGRDTGSEGEKFATDMASQYFTDLGLNKIDQNSFIQTFQFTKEAKLGTRNDLTLITNTQKSLKLNEEWLPLIFSKNGETSAGPIVFAGYGLQVPASQKQQAYNSYNGIDVTDKWVMVLRYLPEDMSAERKLYFQVYAKLEHKAILARDLGAKGIIFVSGPTSRAKNDLIPFVGTPGGDIGIPAISINDETAKQILEAEGLDLKDIQKSLDAEQEIKSVELAKSKISSSVNIFTQKADGRNVIGLLRVPGAKNTLVIGAHMDHLGKGHPDSSLRRSTDLNQIHFGADDNASGSAAVLELAHRYKRLLKEEPSALKQNILFALWSGEELGNLGSSYFLKKIKRSKIKMSAYINMDMIGRWKKNSDQSYEPLSIQGVGSSDNWTEIIESAKIQIPIQLQMDPYLPTDSMAFYVEKIPTLNFFTGVHTDYHTPRDTADKINFSGLKSVTEAVFQITRIIASTDSPLKYKSAPRSTTDTHRRFRISLGTIPDYTQEKISGVKLSGVVSGGPAEKAGILGGDIIVELASNKIESMHDFVFSLETIRANEPTTIVVLRKGKRESLEITPQAKE